MDEEISAEDKIYMYNEAVNLFYQGKSHPQILEFISEKVKDDLLVADIVDKAMHERWHLMYSSIMRLYLMDWIRSDLIDLLYKQEHHKDVIEFICDDIYNRNIDQMNLEDHGEHSMKWWPGLLLLGLFNIWYSLKKGWSIYITIVASVVAAIGIFLAIKTFFLAKRGIKTYGRFLSLEFIKKNMNSSRLEMLFRHKPNKILNVYCTGGYPKLDSTLTVLKSLQDSKADIVEIGIPYSDPLADGPVIQASNAKALINGMTIPVLFKQLENFRREIHLPVILMGYLNPILQYGFEKFCAKAFEVGVDGLIIPDLPIHEYQTQYKEIIKKYGLDFIFLVTPETSEERIRKLDESSSGFLYAVSSSSITGSDKNMLDVESYLTRLQKMNLKNRVLVGFGIKDKSSFDAVCKHANGAIIGTAYLKAIEQGNDIDTRTRSFLEEILK